MVRACLNQFLFPIRVILVIAVARNALVAEPLQIEIPYFVDAAGTEYDLQQEAKVADHIQGLRRGEQFQAAFRDKARLLQRWRVYLRSDGTWAPDPFFGKQDYTEQHYPVEYILPLGYRGAFQVVWGVPGAPPSPIVNDKIEIYIPASGVYETSSALAFTTGTVASPEHQFFFEQDGKRVVIPHEPLYPSQIGINNGTTACRGMPQMCYTYFVGSPEEWRAARSARCPTETEMQAIASGHDCSDVPPGSTQPVAEIVAPAGKPAIMPREFHGRTLNGRRVVLSMGPAGFTSWRFDGPEHSVPDEPALVAELKAYTETLLAPNGGTNLERLDGSPPEMRAVLRASLAGPYRFFRTPYSSQIMGLFVAADTSKNGTVYTRLAFARGEQGWELLTTDHHSHQSAYETISSLNTEISEFVGKAVLQQSDLVVLRNDGTWDSDNPDDLHVATHPAYLGKSFIGHDMNGEEMHFTVDGQGRGTWRRLQDSAAQIKTDTLISELNRALDRYVELLSAGNIEEFLAEGGEQSHSYEFYRSLKEVADDSKQANEAYAFLKQTADGQEILAQSGEDHFKEAMKKALLQAAIQSVDLQFTLQELKRLRNEKPRIAPRTPFSPDFEAVYILPQKDPTQLPTVRRMTGHGPWWARTSA
jgi:hypothetical protein